MLTPRLRLGVALVLAAILSIAATGCGPTATAPPYLDSSSGSVGRDRGWFAPGSTWWGDFGDPQVVRVGNTYYAYSSPTGGRYLPVLTSTDLVTWRVRDRWSNAGPPGARGYSVSADGAIPEEIRGLVDTGAGYYSDTDWARYDNNDAQAHVSWWGLIQPQGPWVKRTVWAPGVAQMGSTWFSYSAVRTSTVSDDPHGFGRFCITMATAPSPTGPFRDASGGGPVQCQSEYADPGGSIDPYPFVDTNAGQNYLLWKAAGKRALPGVTNPHASAIYAAPVGANGVPTFSPPVKLLETNEGSWEGYTIENSAMINYAGRYYLFYSGNYSGTTDSAGHSPYATGYAICPQGPRAACVRQTVNAPLMGSTSTESGPGGASPFVDTQGQLRLSYAFFWPGENRTDAGTSESAHHPRRLNIATLVVNPDGTLTARRRPWTGG